LLSMYNLAISSASDALTLSYAANGITEITNVIAQANGTVDAAFTTVTADFSGLVITIKSWDEGGTVATDWTGTTANLIVIGK